MDTKIKDVEIKKYRVSNDKKNLIVDYADNTSDVFPYSRELELEALEKYKKQLIDKRKDYYAGKKNIKNSIKTIAVITAIGLVFSSMVPVPYCVIPYLLTFAIIMPSVVTMLKNIDKVEGVKKQIALAGNVDKINKHNEEKITELDKVLGKEPELFNLSKHEEYTNEEARNIIREADGNDYELRPLKTAVYQKVKSKFKKC